MRPSELTREQCDIYLLALEFRSLDCKAMHHANHAGVQTSRCKGGADPRLDWAISYLAAASGLNAALIDKAHRSGELTWHESRAAIHPLKTFYWRLERRKLYANGLYWLRVVNG